MVGVKKPNNRGCDACRKKKLKCDQAQPKCQNCVSSDRDCTGNTSGLQFVYNDGSRCSTHPHRGEVLARKREQRRNSETPQKEQTLQALSTSYHVSHSAANETQLRALYANILSLEPLYQSRNEMSTLPPLLDYLPALAQKSSALSYALRALCLMHMGCRNKEDTLRRQSLQPYGQAMGKVRLALTDPRLKSKVETLAASVCLYLYEQVACSDNDGNTWRILFGGSLELTQARGPDSYRALPDHHFFVRTVRNVAVFDAMQRRKATFLANPEWRRVPWELFPKTDMDRLIDIQVLLPRIFELEDQVGASPPSVQQAEKARKLLQTCIYLDSMFTEWFNTLQTQSTTPLSWSTPWSPRRQTEATKLGFLGCCTYESYLAFVDLKTAFLHMYYWAGLTMLYRSIQNLHRMAYGGMHKYTNINQGILTSGQFPPVSTHQDMFTLPQPAIIPPQLQWPPPSFDFPCVTSSEPDLDRPPYQPNGFQHNRFQTQMETPSPPSSYGASSPDPLEPSTCHMTSATLDTKYSPESITNLAHLINRSLPYVLDHTLHELGPDHSAWPIWCALTVLRERGVEEGEKANWCRQMMGMWLREGWGFALMGWRWGEAFGKMGSDWGRGREPEGFVEEVGDEARDVAL